MSDSDTDSFVPFGKQQRVRINSDAPEREVESDTTATARDDSRATLLRRPAAARKKLSKWSVLRHFFIPIEALSFFFVFTMSFGAQVNQAYLYQRIFRVELNITAKDSDCLNDERIINLTGHDVFIEGINKINNYYMGNSLLYLIPSLILTVVVGPISDILGRKPFIFLVQVGQVLGVVVTLVTIHYNLHISIFFLGSLVSGALGGIGAMLSLSFSYVTDITPQSWLTIRMGSLEASFYLGFVASASLANALISKIGCNFEVPMWVVLSTSIVGLMICVVLPKSQNEDLNNLSLSRRDPRYTDKRCSRVLIRGFKLLFWKSDLSNNLWYIWLLIVVLGIAFFNMIGITQMVLYFLLHKPLQWNFATIDIFHAVTSTSHVSIIVVILPLLVIYNVPDIVISFAGSIAAFGMCIFIALLIQPWEMFLAGIILGFEVLVSPSLRAELARTVDRKDIGAVFSIAVAIQVVSLLVATVIFNELYSGKGTHPNPRSIYWAAAGTWAIASIILIVIFLGSKRNSENKGAFFVNTNIFDSNKHGGISSGKFRK